MAQLDRSLYTDTGKGFGIGLHTKELDHAILAGGHRNSRSIYKGIEEHSAGRPDSDRESWTFHIEGAAGEICVSKYLDRHWEFGESRTDVSDYGIEVRTLGAGNTRYGLMVRPPEVKDTPDKICVLVVGKSPNYRVVGWVYAHEANHEEWKGTPNNRPEAFFVPQSHLRSMESLKELIIRSDFYRGLSPTKMAIKAWNEWKENSWACRGFDGRDPLVKQVMDWWASEKLPRIEDLTDEQAEQVLRYIGELDCGLTPPPPSVDPWDALTT